MATAYVAPDFDGRTRFNTLRVKPEYRITLRLGEIEKLFEHKPGTKEGRMERLQVLGLFYFPLKHEKAQARYTDCWRWVKERVFSEKGKPAKTDAEADALLQTALKCRVVGGATPSAWDAPPSELPADAADPAKPGPENFAKIRVPGGYTCTYAKGMGMNLNESPAHPGRFFQDSIFTHEEAFYNDNPALGKIPLVAKVERRPPGGGDWAPGPDVVVHFQLVPAYADLPAYDPARPAGEQFDRPPLRDTDGGLPQQGSGIGPKKRYDTEESHDLKPEDGQGRNCHDRYGGKRGKGVEDVLFSLQETKGFNRGGAPYHKTAKVDAPDAHPRAVKTTTNADGEAGVVFMPSRMGGDRYRLRAYLPMTGDGGRPGSVAATTGTFVIWRNIRISRFLTQGLSPTPDPMFTNEATSYGIPSPEWYLRVVGAHDGSAFKGLADVNLGPNDGTAGGRSFDPMPRQFARAFCELEMDSNAVAPLGPDDWEEARRLAVEDSKQALNGNPTGFKKLLNADLDVLFCRDLPLKPETSVCALPMRAPWEYNNAVPPPKRIDIYNTNLLWNDVEKLVEAHALVGFLRALSFNGSLPGLTLIQSAMGYTWQILLAHHYAGIMQHFRGVFLWYGAGTFDQVGYDCTSNACHETGHAMFMPHAPDTGTSAFERAAHDELQDSYCVMSYEYCTGQYCGKSLMALRGWNIAPMK